MIKLKKTKKGLIIPLVLVFGTLFLLLMAGLMSFVHLQLEQSRKQVAQDSALKIAEAGINYYKWCLTNEIEDHCEGEKDYYDNEGNLVGSYSINVQVEKHCDQPSETTIIATGWTKDRPETKRKIEVLYAKTSVGIYSYLINDNVWAGSDREVRGHYHSNGGIRMDGENKSLVTSAKNEWICTDSFGCDFCPSECREENGDCYCPGVFSTSDNSKTDLFDYPASSFDFNGITMNLAEIKSLSQNEGGHYFPPVKNINSNGEGYHLVFKKDGTFDLYIVTDTNSTYSYNNEIGWHYDYFEIDSEYIYGNFSIASACSLVFIEDRLWVEGEVNGKITIAAANLEDPNKDENVILLGDIEYFSEEENGLALIGQNNILISPASPDIMEIKGIFLAQKGRFGRNHYPFNTREKLEIYGSIISNGRVGTQWTSGGHVISGYMKRENYFDSNLVYKPPPFVPRASNEFKIINWKEVK